MPFGTAGRAADTDQLTVPFTFELVGLATARAGDLVRSLLLAIRGILGRNHAPTIANLGG